MEFFEEVKLYKAKIDSLLHKLLEEEREKATKVSLANEKILDFVVDFCERGGKRLRPILMIKGYEAVGGKDTNEIIRASLSIELLEVELLIHDDIIDKDELRRGGPSFHRMASEWKDEHFGLSAAIIAGDMLGALATRVIMESGFKPELKSQALKEFTRSELDCFHGELYDVILEEENASEEDFLKMVELKTASYTTRAPLVMGAILGGGSDSQIKLLREYGKLLGKAFQIKDDMLGAFGDEKLIGKPVGSDIKQGKKTLALLYALRNVSEEELKFLSQAAGNKDLTQLEIRRVREIFEKSGALNYSKEKAQEYVNKAKSLLSGANFKPESKEFLNKFADFIIEREF